MEEPREIETPRVSKPNVKRCWLHVGMHKTGSTSIQKNLARLKKNADWRYLKVGDRVNMALSLHAMFGSNPLNYHLYVKRGDTPEQLAKKRELLRRKLEFIIRKTKAENLIISSETLSIMDPAEIEALRDFLKPLVDEIRVIAYVRPHGSFRTSWFQQLVKHGKGDFDIDKVKPGYRKRFAKFDRIFGRKNVKLRLFDSSTLVNGCIVADFCAQIGITPPDPAQITRVNESLTREGCGMLYAYRKFGPGYGVGKTALAENSRLTKPMLAMQGTKFRLANAVLAPGCAKDAKDIAWMENRLKASLEEPWKCDGSEVACENDLLRIDRNACAAYLEKFREILGIELPDGILPAENPVDPVKVAEMLENCRQLIRRSMTENEGRTKSDLEQKLAGTGKTFKRCWLHVGMHKTGTTSIQKNLSQKHQPPGWHFLTVGGKPNMGQAIYTMFGTNPENFTWFAKRGETAEQLARKGKSLRAKMEQVIRTCGADNLIISSETLSTMSREEVTALRDFLVPFVEEFRVIGYVRPPSEFRVAWFQQLVKHGRADFEIDKVRLNYRKRFEKYDQIFGLKNVKLCLFSPAALTKGCIVADFCEQIGMPAPAPESILRANERLSREAFAILFAYRKYGAGYGVGKTVVSENTKIIQALQAMKGSKFRLAAPVLAAALERDSKDIGWMERRLNISLKEEWEPDGTEVAGEEDLLRISRSACIGFIEQMRETLGIEASVELIPSGDPLDPVKVAELVEHCRGLIRKSMQRSAPQKIVRKLTRYVARQRRLVSSWIKTFPLNPENSQNSDGTKFARKDGASGGDSGSGASVARRKS